MPVAVDTLALERPRSLKAALVDAGRRPDADADRRLHRRLRRPALRHAVTSSASSICGTSTSCAASASTRGRAAHRRADDLFARSSRRSSCSSACRCWWPRRARWAARRSRIAARSAATSPTPRRPATRCRCWPPRTRAVVLRSTPRRRAPCRSTAFYTGYRTSVRQPDELIVAIEIPAHRRRAVVAQGRHQARAGDLEDHDRRRARPRGARRVRLGRRRRSCSRGRPRRCCPAAARSPTRRRRCWPRSRRSTMCDRRGSIARRWRRTCSRSSGARRHERCVRCIGAWCAVLRAVLRRAWSRARAGRRARDARDGRGARGDGAGAAVSRQR